MAYVEGHFSGARSKRGAILWLGLLAAGSFAVGFVRNSDVDLPDATPAETAVAAPVPVAVNPQPVLQAVAPPPPPVVQEAAPEPAPAPIIVVPIQPAPPPAEAVTVEPLRPPALPDEPLEPTQTLPGRPQTP